MIYLHEQIQTLYNIHATYFTLLVPKIQADIGLSYFTLFYFSQCFCFNIIIHHTSPPVILFKNLPVDTMILFTCPLVDIMIPSVDIIIICTYPPNIIINIFTCSPVYILILTTCLQVIILRLPVHQLIS